MARPLRFLPAGAMVEVTLRTIHGRFLLRPSPVLNDLVIGVLGRAQRKYGMKIHALAVLSNHIHLLVSPDTPQQLAAFMGYFGGNVAREAGRLHDWREKFWARRYRAIIVSDEEEAQVARLSYLLGQGVKEGLVEWPQHWPGVHCAAALLGGTTLQGTWFDRTSLYRARRRGQDPTLAELGEAEQVVLAPLPCLGRLDSAAYRRMIAALIRELVGDCRRARSGRPCVGRRAILAQHPHERPLAPDCSPAPLVHAACRAMRVMLRTAYYEFVAAYREAAQRLRRGDRSVRFPTGAFPPPLCCAVPSG